MNARFEIYARLCHSHCMIRLYFDGGAAPTNPGPMHVCIMIDKQAHFQWLGCGTNNVAEWTALLWGLLVANAQGITELEVIGDSQLIINQANGSWRIKKADFHVFKEEFDAISKSFSRLVVRYEPRKKNLAGHHIERMLKKRRPNHSIR